MRKKIIAGNWKMNLSWEEAVALTDRVVQNLPESAECILAAPFVYLQRLAEKIHGVPGLVMAAQDCSMHAAGAYTGDVSAGMLSSIGVTHCIVGHSERRMYHDETDAVIAAKMNRLLENDMIPVFCCGEKLDERNRGAHKETVASQLQQGLFHLDAGALSRCIVAYEPVWAIGTGVTATVEQAQEMHAWIRESVATRYSSAVADNLTILYGGSVTASNARSLFSCDDVDGGLVGGASLKADEFLKIMLSQSFQRTA